MTHELEPGIPNACRTVTQKIGGERTGFRSAVFVHVDYDATRILAVRLSEKQKDDNPIDRLLHAVGDTVTDIVRKIQEGTI